MILLDASGLFAALDRDSSDHEAAATVLLRGEPLLLSPLVMAQLDYLIARRIGVHAELSFLDAVAGGAYTLVPFSVADLAAARDVIARHADLRIGLADASIVVLAGRYRTNRVLTLDERHFRALRLPDGSPFTLLPADAPE